MLNAVHKFLSYFWRGFLILFTLLLFLVSLSGTADTISVPVEQIDGPTDTLRQFPGASVMGPGEIHIDRPGLLLNLLAPREYTDVLYTLFGFLAAVVVVFYFWDFSYDNPFTRKALTGLRLSFWLLMVFWIGNFSRNEWFDQTVRSITGNQFTYDFPSMWMQPEGWLVFVVLRLVWIFRRGMALQGDTDLTI